MGIVEKIRNNPKLYKAAVTVATPVLNIKSKIEDVKALKQLEQANEGYSKAPAENDPIRVVFIAQYIPAWNKMESVYKAMVDDERFNVYLLCVPDRIKFGELDDIENNRNEVYEYYVDKGYDAINALVGKNKWFDLKRLKPDFVFQSRPYNHYMPAVYTSGEISKYARICSLMYATSLTRTGMKITLNHDYYRNVFCYFAETKESLEFYKKEFEKGHKKGVQHSYYLGYPGYESIVKQKDMKNKAWDFCDKDFRVMWTPRWSTDKKEGGSNFFVYKDAFLEYAKEHENMAFLFRPHPLMFDNFIKTGEMLEDEVNDYKDTVSKMPNTSLDSEKEYVPTFWNSSVLVSDISGIVPEYFITGKPLIFCKTSKEWDYSNETIKMLEGCYVVENKEQLFERLDKLASGEDELEEKRKEILNELYEETLETATKNIVERLAQRTGF